MVNLLQSMRADAPEFLPRSAVNEYPPPPPDYAVDVVWAYAPANVMYGRCGPEAADNIGTGYISDQGLYDESGEDMLYREDKCVESTSSFFVASYSDGPFDNRSNMSLSTPYIDSQSLAPYRSAAPVHHHHIIWDGVDSDSSDEPINVRRCSHEASDIPQRIAWRANSESSSSSSADSEEDACPELLANAPRRKRRKRPGMSPCKAQRLRFRKAWDRFLVQIEEAPDEFPIDEIHFPPSMALKRQVQLRKKLVDHIAESKAKKEASVEALVDIPSVDTPVEMSVVTPVDIPSVETPEETFVVTAVGIPSEETSVGTPVVLPVDIPCGSSSETSVETLVVTPVDIRSVETPVETFVVTPVNIPSVETSVETPVEAPVEALVDTSVTT